MLSDKKMRRRMVNGWRGGLHEGTVCGQGSLHENTAKIRHWLPIVCKEYGIESIADAGAGDMHWIKSMVWGVDYYPYDLIPRSHDIEKCDITRAKMRETDAILCRMVLNHLCDGDDYTRVDMALDNFVQTAKYLFATHFVDGGPHRERQFQRLDLTKWLGQPLEMCRDGHEDNCRLALWKL